MNYMIRNLNPLSYYLFKVRAYNQCGFVESEMIGSRLPVAPTRVVRPVQPIRVVRPVQPVTVVEPVDYNHQVGSGTISTKGCNAVITWPSSTANYKSNIEVLGADKRYHNVNVCGQRGRSSCNFHMSTLTNAPFNLANNQPLQGRVRTCVFGECSPYTLLQSSAVLITAPPSAIPDTQFEQLIWDNEGNYRAAYMSLSWYNFAAAYDVT